MIDKNRDVLAGASALLLALLGGCTTVSTHFDEQITENVDGSIVTNTIYEAKSQAAPLGKLETANQQWTYRWGGEENVIGTGQAAQGLDNTGQTVIVDLIRALLGELRAAYETGQVEKTNRAAIDATRPPEPPIVLNVTP